MIEICRGDVVWVNCSPSVGVEPRKLRTCVIVSNNVANRFGAAVTVVPTQHWTKERALRLYMVDLRPPRSSMDVHRVANCSMVMTYDRRRVVRAEGSLAKEALAELDEALALHLGLVPL
ncbi:MAG: type II toxin-antitoxin system PemK/MazF family toxin [Proteobacteria bacterium]|jgi:mRNA interferase MazF|nr:type II toxin-antitoxin system PemK/MazF family toxin [Pseudomonadota bacterium]